jgi:DNA-binding MltR family transcriptional regulator
MNKVSNKENQTEEILKAQNYWNNVLKQEFEKETDRGAAIFATSLFDAALRNLLIGYFVANTNSKDEIFDGPNAPLSTLSSKIIMSYRLGILSDRYVRDLNLIRKIRNEFAHNIQGCDFNHSGILSRIQELEKSSQTVAKLNIMKGLKESEDNDARNIFLQTCSWMLAEIQNKIEKLKPLTQATMEFGYIEIETIRDFKKFIDKRQKEEAEKKDKK